MGTEIAQRSTQFAGEDRRWLDGGLHGQNTNKDVMLDGDLFPAGTFPDGRVPSGVLLGIVAATNLAGPFTGLTEEVQTITVTATGGTFTITFSGQVTGPLAFDSSAATVEAALVALSNIGPGEVTVTKAGSVFTLTFGGALADTDVAEVTTSAAALTPAGSTATVATTVQGGAAGSSDGRQLPVGHLLNTETVRPGARILTAAVRHGVVNRNMLPASSGHSAAAEALLPSITYQNL